MKGDLIQAEITGKISYNGNHIDPADIAHYKCLKDRKPGSLQVSNCQDVEVLLFTGKTPGDQGNQESYRDYRDKETYSSKSKGKCKRSDQLHLK